MSGDPFAPDAFRQLGHRFVDALADHLAATADRAQPVLRWQPPEAKLHSLPPLDGSADAEAPLQLLARLLAESNRLHHPRFVGHQVNPPLPLAALMEFASALLNNGMAVYEMGPLQTAMEQRVVDWMAQRLGLPAGADGVLTSGGSIGNLTALLAARQRHGDAWRRGGGGGAILVSEGAHYCVDRAARIMGLGDDGVVRVPVDAAFRLRAEALPAALQAARQRGRTPFAVVASACSTATGAFDPLPQVADFCRQHELWLHVDGAHGASYCLSARHRALLAGIDRADSVVWDAHKLLLMPALVTGVLFGDGAASYAPFAQQAAYLFAQSAQPHDRGLRTLECTKRGLSVGLYTCLKTLGEAPFAAFLDHTFALAEALAAMVEAAPDFELATPPQANIVCFRHLPAGGDVDAHQRALRQRLLADGRFYVVQATLPKGVFLRTTFSNPRTTTADLEALLQRIRELA